MGKRTQPYEKGWPKKYFTGMPNSGSDQEWADNMNKRKEAYKKGEKIDLKNMDAGGKVSAKALSSAVMKTLNAKAKSSGISVGKLRKVFRRGQGAWMSGGSRKGTNMNQWAFGRVNSFIRGSKKHDTDLRK